MTTLSEHVLEPIKELRVHGVSGTPPREMLHTDPVVRADSKGPARIYQERPSHSHLHPSGRPYQTEAFHWGSLTTGHWLTSLWILLAPFAFANVAGWMSQSRGPARRLMIRIAGLALTALFVAQVGYVIMGVPVAFAERQDWASVENLEWIRAGLGLGYVLVFGAIVLRLSAQSHFEPLSYRRRFQVLFSPKVESMTPLGQAANWEDPGAARVTEPVMWRAHSIVHRLRRLHFAGGLLVTALVLARIGGNDLLINLALLGTTVVVIALALTTYRPTGITGLTITAWIPLIAEAIAIGAVAGLFGEGVGLDLGAIHRTTFEVAIALGVAGAACLISGFPSVGALTIGTLFGGALGVGAGFIAEDLLSAGGTLVDQGGAWVAPVALIFVLTIATAALIMTFRAPPLVSTESPANSLLTRVTRQSRGILALAALFGLVSGVVAFIQGCLLPGTTCRPAELAELAGVDAVVAGFLVGIPIVLAVRLAAINRKGALGAILAASAMAYVVAVEPTWGDFTPSSYLKALPLARTLIFVAPVVAIARSALGAYRQGASSRKVGVLWDVASFWPRWYHPLAPPAYGPKVVATLQEHIENGAIDILAGHSQGSVIAAVATYQACSDGAARPIGLITYGSPLEMLYATLFPDAGVGSILADLPSRMEHGWVNLWRDDDPVGGKALSGDVANRIASGSGHSGYELTAAYRTARDSLA